MAVISKRFDRMGADGRPARLGIMGGTFDPIHMGHLICAEQAREAFNLDGVIFIPAAYPVFKKDRVVEAPLHRLKMCQSAVEGNAAFDVSSLEIERGGDSYTVDTLRQIRAHYPCNVELYFIIGTDALCDISQWHESAALADLTRLIAVARPGCVLPQGYDAFAAKHSNFTIDYLEIPALFLSSSDLRSRVAAGKSIRYLTAQSVCDYIYAHGLYKVKNEKKPSRKEEGRL